MLRPSGTDRSVLAHARFSIFRGGGLRPVVIAGNFKVWMVEWDSHFTSAKGWVLFEYMVRENVEFAKVGVQYT